MRFLVLLVTALFAAPAMAAQYVYLVAPKTVEVKTEVGTSCLAAQNGKSGDLTTPHIRIPATVANPQRVTFFPTAFKIFVFVKGDIKTCEFSGDALTSLGMPPWGVPTGYQATTACELSCDGLNIPAGQKAFATLEVYGFLKLPLDENKTVFEETSFEVVNPATP